MPSRTRSRRKSRSRQMSRSKSRSKSRSRSRSKTITELKPGMLTKFKYHVHMPTKEKHASLKKAYKAYGYSTLIKRLNILAVYNKYKHPDIAELVHKDMEYVRKLDEKQV